jgi:hypothetical protein
VAGQVKVLPDAQLRMGMALMFLSMNHGRRLGCPTARNPKDGFMSVAIFVGHGSKISSSSWAGKIELSLCLVVNHHAMKAYEGVYRSTFS